MVSVNATLMHVCAVRWHGRAERRKTDANVGGGMDLGRQLERRERARLTGWRQMRTDSDDGAFPHAATLTELMSSRADFLGN